LCDHGEVLDSDTVCGVDVVDERIQILDESTHAGCEPTPAGRVSMSSGVPCKHRVPRQLQFIDNVLKPAGMFMAPVQQQDGAIIGTL
jgi:hypothetical protein